MRRAPFRLASGRPALRTGAGPRSKPSRRELSPAVLAAHFRRTPPGAGTSQTTRLRRMTPGASRDAVLLLTHSGDFYTIDLVSQARARRGARPFRCDTDLFPSSVKL